MPPRKFISPLPDESDYIARRVEYSWLLRHLWFAKLAAGEVAGFAARLARRFDLEPPALVRTSAQNCWATPWDFEGGLIELGGYTPDGNSGRDVPVGLIVHEYAHIIQWHWHNRMRGPAGKKPEWEDHGSAFIDALDKVAIEAAKLLR